MIHSIYYYSVLKSYTHTTQQSTNTRILDLVSVLKSYTNRTLNQPQKRHKRHYKKAYKISTNNYFNVVNRVRIVFNRIRLMLTIDIESQKYPYLRGLLFVKKTIRTYGNKFIKEQQL